MFTASKSQNVFMSLELEQTFVPPNFPYQKKIIANQKYSQKPSEKKEQMCQ